MEPVEQKYLEKFKSLYLQKEGKTLSDVEAVKKFNSLVSLVRNVYLPIPTAKQKQFQDLFEK